jgi:hypothetical protein
MGIAVYATTAKEQTMPTFCQNTTHKSREVDVVCIRLSVRFGRFSETTTFHPTIASICTSHNDTNDSTKTESTEIPQKSEEITRTPESQPISNLGSVVVQDLNK